MLAGFSAHKGNQDAGFRGFRPANAASGVRPVSSSPRWLGARAHTCTRTAAQHRLVDVVLEHLATVDEPHRYLLAPCRLQRGIAGDVDPGRHDAELGSQRLEHGRSLVTEAAAWGGVDGELTHGQIIGSAHCACGSRATGRRQDDPPAVCDSTHNPLRDAASGLRFGFCGNIPPIMELTERAWMIVQRAQEEARALGDAHVGTDHMLLAMLRDGEGAGAYVLEDLGVDYNVVFERLVSAG